MRKRLLLHGLALPLFVAPLLAQDAVPRRSYGTTRVAVSPEIDGRLDDAAWRGVSWTGDFVQRQPVDGAEPSAETEFKVVYDDEALYFAFRAHDDPSVLSSILERRDRFPGDWIEVNIDSYLDRRTAFSFTFSLSGTRGDEFISDDGRNWDGRWDPIWGGASQVDDQGWT
ncbi:MAG: carbohydrate binding family 9 domain-containing protein, partial [Thermoanaerobaculia bacterium]|nr:carbohydrate binding family 9 domain-containing protein [Thermoanaerobaculia bacterium]